MEQLQRKASPASSWDGEGHPKSFWEQDIEGHRRNLCVLSGLRTLLYGRRPCWRVPAGTLCGNLLSSTHAFQKQVLEKG